MKTVKRKAEVGDRVILVDGVKEGRTGKVVHIVGGTAVLELDSGKDTDKNFVTFRRFCEVIEDEPKTAATNIGGHRIEIDEDNSVREYGPPTITVDEPAIPPHSTAATEEVALNPILREIHWKIVSQTEKGLKKYGKPVHPDNHSLTEWIDHAVEESIDHITYLLMMKKKIEEGAE